MNAWRELCRLDDVPDNGAIAFPGKLFAVRSEGRVAVYVNACPHLGVPLDWLPGKFLSADGRMIVCATHGAQFQPMDGICVSGPCRGDRLKAVPHDVRDGIVRVAQACGQTVDQGPTLAC